MMRSQHDGWFISLSLAFGLMGAVIVMGAAGCGGGGGSTDAHDGGGGTTGADARDAGPDAATPDTSVADARGDSAPADATGVPDASDARAGDGAGDADGPTAGGDGRDAAPDAADAGIDTGPATECTPGALRCTGATSEMCSAIGHWASGMVCVFGCAAATGMCNGCTDDAMATTCAGGACGSTLNNCGRTVECDATCPGTGESCGGGEVPGVCGCSDQTNTLTCGGGTRCGDVVNNCGHTINCGACKAQGAACAVAGQCLSGFCMQGVCCATACTGTCRSCALAGAEGTCQSVPSGQDPLNQCAESGPATCATDGTCDGNGGCRLYASGTSCGAASCAAGALTPARTCDGTGSCSPPSTLSCAPYICATTTATCTGSCVTAADCAPNNVCAGGRCASPLANAVACTIDAACASGHCTDGVCCNSACAGTCEACNLAAQVGICAPVAAGQDPGNDCAAEGEASCGRDGTCDGARACRRYAAGTQCAAPSCTGSQRTVASRCDGAGACVAGAQQTCAPYVCGANGDCLSSCATGVECLSPNVCVGGACGKLPIGSACGATSECASGFCEQGICCATACTGTCRSCALAGSLGACSLIPAGQDPLQQCAQSDAATCATDGTCDGAGACRLYAAGVTCAPPSCVGTTLTTQRTCNGSGTCLPATTASCLTFACGAGACKTGCAGDGDCASGAYCNGTTCVPKKVTGTLCAAGGECVSGSCTDNVCCETACLGSCQACSASRTGVADGLCRPVTGGTDPDNECAASAASTCGTDGMCDGAGACRRWAAGTVCVAASCAASMATPARTCDGIGTCQTVTSVVCSPFVCGATACKTSCATDADCETGDYCASGGACVPRKAQGVVCAAADECASGSCVDSVCCESACAGLCLACAGSRTGQASGLCRPILPGTDPDNECAESAMSTCGSDGTCDGAGACHRWIAGTVCADATCGGTTYTPPRTCNGGGTCLPAGAPSSCGAYTCGATACKITCAGDGDCVAPAVCGAGGRASQCGVPATLSGAASLDFGAIEVGSTSDPLAPAVWTITNSGDFATAALLVTRSTTEIAYVANGCGGVVLLPGQSCSISFTFGPAAVGARGGTITVTGAAGESTVFTATASGIDTTPPAWQAGPTVTAVLPAPTTLSVSWTAAVDIVSPAASIRYRLCWATGASTCAGQAFTTMATVTGATSTTITGLTSRTPYTVWVRAEDQAGNVAALDHSAAATTATSYSTDVFTNTFGGICATCHGGGWSRASTVNVATGFDAGAGCGGVLNYITPGSPQTSYIFHKMNALDDTTAPFSTACPDEYNGLRMPRNGPYDTTNIAIMYDWITQGALNN